jgi:hypothetical protein
MIHQRQTSSRKPFLSFVESFRQDQRNARFDWLDYFGADTEFRIAMLGSES